MKLTPHLSCLSRSLVTLLASLGAASAWANTNAFDQALQAQQRPASAAQAAPVAVAPAPAVAAPAPAAARRHRVAHRRHEEPVRRTPRAANESYGGEAALSCRTVNWKRGDIIRLQAQPHKQVHIALPENGIDVIMGDKELWALDWINNRIFLKPTSRSNEGRSTTISAIGQSGNAYEFVVNRISDGAEVSHCVYLTSEGSLVSRAAWAKPTDREREITTALGREIVSLREQNDNLDRANRDGMKNYRKKVNSNYSWRKGIFSRWNGGDVDTVYDDGRFTYVRMKDDGQGLASISAEIDGKSQLLEYGYDAPSRTYQISGVFPRFVLRAGDQSMAIDRKS